MFSLRALALIGAAIYLLPSDPADRQRFAATVSGAYSWAATTCEREPELCVRAGHVWQELKDKAHFGFGVVYGLAVNQRSETSGRGFERSTSNGKSVQALRGTLTAADVVPSWRGDDGTKRAGR